MLKKVAEGKPHVHEYVTGAEARRYREGYVWHSFEAKFLTQQMLMDFDSFPYGEMRMGSDFATNLALENDDALQAEHWSPQQVTMYVVIARVGPMGWRQHIRQEPRQGLHADAPGEIQRGRRDSLAQRVL